MIKQIFVAAGFLFTGLACHAQYYYKDILSNKQVLDDLARLKEQKIKSVKITSLEADGQPSEGFLVEKRINRNYTSVETFTRSGGTGASLLTTIFSKSGALIQTSDSSDLAVNTSTYFYDDKQQIKSIQSHIRSSDDDFTTEITEEHIYEYNEKGLLLKMYRIKNTTDTTLILFSTDEKNNISIEKDTRTGKSYYYYYDNKNRLTDLVHATAQNQKMIPDYVFEYNTAGQVTQMTSIEEGGSYYYIWKYTYSDGLRTREKCFSKEKRLLGSIEYEYN